MRAVSAFIVGLAIATSACGLLFDADDLRGGPAGGPSFVDDAGPSTGTDSSGPHDEQGDGGAEGRGAPSDGDPRWALWPIPADTPDESSYSIQNGPDGAIIKDKITGLEWQDAVPSTLRNFVQATRYCDDLVYNGESDWRLPTRIEATSIMSFGSMLETETEASVFTSVKAEAPFPTQQRFRTCSRGPNGEAWSWTAAKSAVEGADDDEPLVARCVRAGAPLGAPIPKQFEILGADMARDPITKLVWQRAPSSKGHNRDDAARFCQDLELGGRTWRLPGVKELASLIDETTSAPALTGAFSVSLEENYSSNKAWNVSFDRGRAFEAGNGLPRARTRCVSGP